MRQLRDSSHGTRFRITSSLPAAAPEELTDRHLHHMAIEYTNWARIARTNRTQREARHRRRILAGPPRAPSISLRRAAPRPVGRPLNRAHIVPGYHG